MPLSLRRLEFFARGPGALPILLRRPSVGFEEMEVTRATGQLGEMPHRHQGFVDEPLLHLLAIKLEPETVVIGTSMKRLPQLLDRRILSGSRKRRFFAELTR